MIAANASQAQPTNMLHGFVTSTRSGHAHLPTIRVAELTEIE